jgi:hypothetical protein
VGWWTQTALEDLAQGDLVKACDVLILPDEYGLGRASGSGSEPPGQSEYTFRTELRDVVLMSQTCDMTPIPGKLEPPRLVSVCAAAPLKHTDFRTSDRRESLRQGRTEGLCLLACPGAVEDQENALVVDFREIFTLPYRYVLRRARETAPRWRIEPPYREHLSHAFSRYFSRVALAEQIPRYR